MPFNSIIRTYTQGFGTRPGSSVWGSGDDGKAPSQLTEAASNPKSFSRLFPSMHTLSSLDSIRDPSQYSGQTTTHFNDDVGIMAQNSAHIGHGAQFDVRRIKMCCDKGFYVQKSALSAAYRKRSAWRETKDQQQEAEEHMIRAVFLEYRALSHPPIKAHPNIVDILDLGWETDPENGKDKWPVLILEYADQGTMTAFLSQSRFSLETRTKLCLDVAKGLTVLHESGISHGDLKMENVLIFTNKGVDTASVNKYTAKLADFGASLVEQDGKRSPSHSKPWNATECFDRLDFEGLKKLDVYSFGLLCWAVMLGGRNPFAIVEKVTQRLDPGDWDASLERLKKEDNGMELLRLAQESFVEAFGHQKPPVVVIDATVQLDPTTRNLPKAVTALEEFLVPLKTEDEASFARNQPTSLLAAPSICSHKIILTSHELQTYRGPLRTYLTEWLQEHPGGSGDQTNDRVAHSLLAELELDDWLDGRSPDPSKVIAHYRTIQHLHPWESSILYRLASAHPTEENKQVIHADNMRDSQSDAFCSAFTPALTDMSEQFPEWAADNVWVALSRNNAGVYEVPIDGNMYKAVAMPDDTDVSSALKQVFPSVSIGTAVSQEADSDLEVDFTTAVLNEESGNLAIHILSQVGDAGLLRKLLEMPGVDINARNKRLDTPLLLACRGCRFSTAMLLIEEGADVSLQNIFKENVLHWLSSFRFSPNEMKELGRAVLAKGTRDLLTAEADFRESRDSPEHRLEAGTPICRAIIKGFDEAALLLWEMECEAFAPDRPAYSAIHYAAMLHNSRLLDVFLEGPSDLMYPATGVSLLYTASVDKGTISNSGVGRVLRHGVRCGQSGIDTFKVLCKYGANDHFASIPGLPDCNVLSLAVRECAPEVVEFLLMDLDCARFINIRAPPPHISLTNARGDDIKYSIDTWKSSLLYVAMLLDRLRVFELLLEHGADVNEVLGSQDGPLTTLHYSVVMGRDTTYVKRLLATGKITNVDNAAADFESPFSTAVRMRKFSIAECLLAHGADVNYLFVNGVRSFPDGKAAETVLASVMAQEGSLSSLACVSFLLRTGRASPWTNRTMNMTVLHSLAMRSSTNGDYNEEFVRRAFAMLDTEFHFGKDVLNARTKDGGATALELAVLNDKAVLVEKLLHAGAEWDVVLPNPKGFASPLVFAMKRMYNFPNGVAVEENCPPKEKQLDMAFTRQRHICLMLCRKAREKARESAEMLGSVVVGGQPHSLRGPLDSPTGAVKGPSSPTRS